MMPECKCKGCLNRKIGCHADCEDYKEFKMKLDVINKARSADNQYETLMRDIKDARRHMDHHKKKREHYAPN